jgi:hypothetical protein
MLFGGFFQAIIAPHKKSQMSIWWLAPVFHVLMCRSGSETPAASWNRHSIHSRRAAMLFVPYWVCMLSLTSRMLFAKERRSIQFSDFPPTSVGWLAGYRQCLDGRLGKGKANDIRHTYRLVGFSHTIEPQPHLLGRGSRILLALSTPHIRFTRKMLASKAETCDGGLRMGAGTDSTGR